MANLLEFNELPTGQQVGIATQSGGVISGVAVDPSSLPSSLGGLVTFATVARASSNRMLDAPLSMVQQWIDGQPIYSSSFGGAHWHWQADFPAGLLTDNVNTCRPTAWVATGLDGAAVRDTWGNWLARRQDAWAINSTAADNEGTGSALDPLKTDDEIQRRWGFGLVAPLPVPVTVTYAQAPTTETNYSAALLPDASFNLVGTPTITKQGTAITAVQAQVRTSGSAAAWAVTGVGLGASDVGKLLRITASVTPSKVGAYARILKDETGGKVRVSPFGTGNVSFVPFVAVTPVIGDVVEVVEPMTLKVGAIRIQSATQQFLEPSPNQNVFTTDSITLDGGSAGYVLCDGTNSVYLRTILKDIVVNGPADQLFWAQSLAGGGTQGTVRVSNSLLFLFSPGCSGSLTASSGGQIIAGTDSYFQTCQLASQIGAAALFTQGAAFFDCASNQALFLSTAGSCVQGGAVADWGTNNTNYGLVAQSGATYAYQTKPTINGGLGAGREANVGGTDKQWAAIPYFEATNGAAVVVLQ
jgi:hypothetical protein